MCLFPIGIYTQILVYLSIPNYNMYLSLHISTWRVLISTGYLEWLDPWAFQTLTKDSSAILCSFSFLDHCFSYFRTFTFITWLSASTLTSFCGSLVVSRERISSERPWSSGPQISQTESTKVRAVFHTQIASVSANGNVWNCHQRRLQMAE